MQIYEHLTIFTECCTKASGTKVGKLSSITSLHTYSAVQSIRRQWCQHGFRLRGRENKRNLSPCCEKRVRCKMPVDGVWLGPRLAPSCPSFNRRGEVFCLCTKRPLHLSSLILRPHFFCFLLPLIYLRFHTKHSRKQQTILNEEHIPVVIKCCSIVFVDPKRFR